MNALRGYYSFYLHVNFFIGFICALELAIIVLCLAFKLENPFVSCRFVNISLDNASPRVNRSAVDVGKRQAHKCAEENFRAESERNATNKRIQLENNGPRNVVCPQAAINEKRQHHKVMNRSDSLIISTTIISKQEDGFKTHKNYHEHRNHHYNQQQQQRPQSENGRRHRHRLWNYPRYEASPNGTTYLNYVNALLNPVRVERQSAAPNLNWSIYSSENAGAAFLARFGKRMTRQRRVCSSYALFVCFVIFHAICDVATLISMVLERDRLVLPLLLLLVMNVSLSVLFLFSGFVAFAFMSEGFINKDYYFMLFVACQALLRGYEFICARKLYWYYQMSAEALSRPHSALLPINRHKNNNDSDDMTTVISDTDTVELEEAARLFEF